MKRTAIDRLILVFDANSGTWSAVLDSARKLLSLEACALCSITHGLAGEKPEWSACKTDLGVSVDYLHRDELTAEYRRLTQGRLPCIVAETARSQRVLVSRKDLDACDGDPAALVTLIRERARDAGLSLPEPASP